MNSMESNWIKVEDQMPDDELGVLVFGFPKHHGDKGESEVLVASFGDLGWFECYYEIELIVSHWMPFPEKPKID